MFDSLNGRCFLIDCLQSAGLRIKVEDWNIANMNIFIYICKKINTCVDENKFQLTLSHSN